MNSEFERRAAEVKHNYLLHERVSKPGEQCGGVKARGAV